MKRRLIAAILGAMTISAIGATNKVYLTWTETPNVVHFLLGKTNMNNPKEPGWTLCRPFWHFGEKLQRQVDVLSLPTRCHYFTMCTGDIGWFTNRWYYPDRDYPVELTITTK